MMLRAVLAVAALAVATTPAAAQHHHHHGAHDEGGAETARAPALALQVGLSLEVGRVEAFASEVDYQGAALMVGARRGDFELGAHVPYYRIDLGARTGTGLGDIHVEGRWLPLRRGALEAGVSAAVMLPFGNDDDGLAMAHWMIMTGGVARVSRGRLSGNARLGYNGALEGNAHADHPIDIWPPVAPMNAHEIAASAGGAIALGHGVAATAQLGSAVPIGDGEFLALAEIGATVRVGRFDLGLGLRHGLAGHTAGLVGTSHAMASF
jgi:hypothetical protein